QPPRSFGHASFLPCFNYGLFLETCPRDHLGAPGAGIGHAAVRRACGQDDRPLQDQRQIGGLQGRQGQGGQDEQEIDRRHRQQESRRQEIGRQDHQRQDRLQAKRLEEGGGDQDRRQDRHGIEKDCPENSVRQGRRQEDGRGLQEQGPQEHYRLSPECARQGQDGPGPRRGGPAATGRLRARGNQRPALQYGLRAGSRNLDRAVRQERQRGATDRLDLQADDGAGGGGRQPAHG